jgi:hypothetical protein
MNTLDIFKKYGAKPLEPTPDETRSVSTTSPSYTQLEERTQLEKSTQPEDTTSPALSILQRYGAKPIEAPASATTATETSAPKETTVLEDIKLGVKESFLPFSVTKEEAKTEGTITRAIANITSDIAGLLAAGKVGATVGGAVAGPVGAIVGGTGATVGLGIYRALGMEKVRATADEREMSPKNIAVNLVTETLPIVRHAKLGMNLALSGAQAAAQFEQARQYGASGEMAALIAVVGGSVAAATRRSVSKEEVERLGALAFVTEPTMSKQAVNGLDQVLQEGKDKRITQQVYEYLDTYRTQENTFAKIITEFPTNRRQQIAYVKQLSPDTKQSLLELPELKEAVEIFKQSPPGGKKFRTDENLQTYVILNAIKEQRAGMAFYFTKESGYNAIQKLNETLQKQALTFDEAHKIYRTHRLVTDRLKQALADVDDVDISRAMGWVASDYHVARAIDDVTGLDLRSRIDRLAQSELSHRGVVIDYQRKIFALEKEIRKAKVDSKDLGRMLEMSANERMAYITANYAKNASKVQDLLTKTRALFDDMREFGIANGIHIPYRENYFTSMMQDAAQATANLNRVAKQIQEVMEKNPKLKTIDELIDMLKDNPLAVSARQLRTVLTNTFEDLKEKPIELTTLDRYINKFERLTIEKQSIGFEASAAFARKGELPELIREREVGTVLRAYARNISRAVHFDSQIKELAEYRDALQTLGLKNAANWLDRYIKTQSGHPGFVQAAISATYSKMRSNLLKSLENTSQAKQLGTKATLAAIDFMAYVPSIIYQNFLGARLGPIILNMTQTPMLTGPEIGGIAGQKLVAKGALKTALAMRKGSDFTKEVEDYINAAKAVPELASRWRNVRVASKNLNALEEIQFANTIQAELTKGRLKRSFDAMIGVSGKLSLGAYTFTDTINRHITINISKELTKDILRNKPYALKFVKQGDTSLKTDIGRIQTLLKQTTDPARKAALEKTLEYTVAGYLIGKTQFYYTKASSSAWARELGPLFSMFTKFPQMLGSDVYEKLVRKKEYSKFVQQYVAPTVVVMGFYQLLGDYKDEPRAQALRLNNAWRMTPISAVEVSPPPVLPIPGKAIQILADVVNGDLEKAGGRIVDIGSTIMPGAWVVAGAKDAYKIIANERFEE